MENKKIEQSTHNYGLLSATMSCCSSYYAALTSAYPQLTTDDDKKIAENEASTQ